MKNNKIISNKWWNNKNLVASLEKDAQEIISGKQKTCSLKELKQSLILSITKRES